MSRRRFLVANQTISPLPSGYVLLDYIESTGEQYIELDLPITKDTVCRIKFNLSAPTGNCIMGSSGSFRFFNAGNGAYLDWARGYGGGRINGGRIDNNTTYDIEFGDWYVKNLDTGDYIIQGTAWGDTVRYLSDKIMLMYIPKQHPSVKAKGKFYLSQVIEKGELVCNLFPCVDPSGAVGMYDTVSRKFYSNSGTGAFVAGYKDVT